MFSVQERDRLDSAPRSRPSCGPTARTPNPSVDHDEGCGPAGRQVEHDATPALLLEDDHAPGGVHVESVANHPPGTGIGVLAVACDMREISRIRSDGLRKFDLGDPVAPRGGGQDYLVGEAVSSWGTR